VASNGGDSSASRTQVLSSQTSVQKWLSFQSQSHFVTDGQSVSQSLSQSWCWVLIWSSWPGISFCLTVTVLSMWGALSDERMGLSFVSNNMSVVRIYNIFTFYMLYMLLTVCIYNICKATVSPGSIQQIMPLAKL
jgi:hypothetical protein